MKWQELLDHLITVEGECMEENYGKGRALNDADEECNAGIRQAYQSLLKVRPSLMAAPEMLAALIAVRSSHSHIETADMPDWLEQVEDAIAKAEGRSE